MEANVFGLLLESGMAAGLGQRDKDLGQPHSPQTTPKKVSM